MTRAYISSTIPTLLRRALRPWTDVSPRPHPAGRLLAPCSPAVTPHTRITPGPRSPRSRYVAPPAAASLHGRTACSRNLDAMYRQTALVHVSSRPKNTSGVESVPGVAVGPGGATAARGPSLPGVETCSGQTCPAAPTHPPLSRPPGQPETCPLDSFRGALLPQTRRRLVVFWQALT